MNEDDDDEPLPPYDVSLTETVSLVEEVTTRRLALACVVKRTYAIGKGGKLTLADEQAPLITDPEVELDEYEEHKLLADDTDIGPPKEVTDVVVLGSAHAAEPVRELFVAVAVSGFARRLLVTGERRVEVRPDGTVRISPAERFQRVPLGYEVAYGGYDEYAQYRIAPPTQEELNLLGPRPFGIFAYPRNSAGRAYFLDLDRQRADGALMPQVEDPLDALIPERFFVPRPKAWIDAPVPGALGWLHHAWYPRFVRFAGPLLEHDPPARPIREIDLGGGDDLADPAHIEDGRMHPRALQGAAPGLARERLRGDEPIVLQNLHPTIPDLRFNLPGEVPVFSLSPPDVKAFSPKPVLQTVRIEPDLGRISLVWCGAVPILAQVDEEFLDRCELDVTWTRR
jgi:hypothetical protein